MKPQLAVLSSLQQQSGHSPDPSGSIKWTTKDRSNIDFMLRRMTARARVHVCVCARQRTNSKPHTSSFLFFSSFLQTTCPSVCYNNTRTKEDMSHSQGGGLHNAHDCIQLHTGTLPLYLPGVVSARSQSRCLAGSQTEHWQGNCRGKGERRFQLSCKTDALTDNSHGICYTFRVIQGLEEILYLSRGYHRCTLRYGALCPTPILTTGSASLVNTNCKI